MLRCKKIPWNFPWNHSPKRGWFHSIYIIEWKVPGLWFHGNSMERGSRCPTLGLRDLFVLTKGDFKYNTFLCEGSLNLRPITGRGHFSFEITEGGYSSFIFTEGG
jgi:hypothetical protein